MYSCETIRMLSVFLATNTYNVILSKMHAFAPDNLSWLWSLIDWESAIEFENIPTHDYYQRIDSLDKFEEFEVAEAPLIQCAYNRKF